LSQKRTASANTIVLIDIFEDMAASYQGLDDVALYIKQLRRGTTELAFLPMFSTPELIALSQSRHGVNIAN
jgi:hypothetical protein